MSLEATFTNIFKQNSWKSEESVSGTGSTKKQTRAVRAMIPGVLGALNIRSVLDIPCGDYSWWPLMDLEGIEYIGADIVPDLIKTNRINHPGVDFRVLDITGEEPLPKVDLIFCRDCLGHLSNWNIERSMTNFRLSGAKYLMTTTFYDSKWQNLDINDGEWRPINLINSFGLKRPTIILDEEMQDKYGRFTDKSLGVWEL